MLMNMEAMPISENREQENHLNEEKERKRRRKLSVALAGALTLSPMSDSPNVHDTRIEQEALSFAERVARAKKEMAAQGITSEQRTAYKPGISDVIYRNVDPWGYGTEFLQIDKIEKVFKSLVSIEPRPSIRWLQEEGMEKGYEETRKQKIAREDAWRLYLGIPQIYGTFSISEYQPGKRSEQKYYFKINDFWSSLVRNYPGSNKKELIREVATSWFGKLQNQKLMSDLNGSRSIGDSGDRAVMGSYTLSRGSDERGYYISYYDKWDLKVPLEADGFIGKPYEIYDRLYYDPKTFEPIETK